MCITKIVSSSVCNAVCLAHTQPIQMISPPPPPPLTGCIARFLTHDKAECYVSVSVCACVCFTLFRILCFGLRRLRNQASVTDKTLRLRAYQQKQQSHTRVADSRDRDRESGRVAELVRALSF